MKTKQKTVYKTVCQYNAKDIPEADMKMFQEIARDYCKVKNYIYQRYGGIGSLAKIYPGYTVQNEMTGWTQGETWNAFRIFLSGSF